jgi:6-phosphofructokinase
MGVKAVELLLSGESNVMVGLQGMGLVSIPLEEVTSQTRPAAQAYYEMAKMLAR